MAAFSCVKSLGFVEFVKIKLNVRSHDLIPTEVSDTLIENRGNSGCVNVSTQNVTQQSVLPIQTSIENKLLQERQIIII